MKTLLITALAFSLLLFAAPPTHAQAESVCGNVAPRCGVDNANPLRHCIKCTLRHKAQNVEDTQCRRASIDSPSDADLKKQALAGLAHKCGVGRIGGKTPTATRSLKRNY